MRAVRPKTTLKLNEDEERELTFLAHRSRSAPTMARRVHVNPGMVGKGRNRFLQERLERPPEGLGFS